MKKIKHSFLKKFNIVLIALLALLGFSNCERTSFEQPEFIVKGTITSKIDGKPVEGIRISSGWIGAGLMYGTPMPDFRPKSPVHSNQNGNFVSILNDTIRGNILHIQDVDRGLFRDTTIVVNFEKGRHIANIDIALTPKTNE
jgi:putative lipoprotein (rSAM/lipoprotein system)